MPSHGHATGWILLGVYALLTVVLPLLVGVVSRTARRAALFSTLLGLLATTAVVGMAVYLRGMRGLPSGNVVAALFVVGTTLAIVVALGTRRIAGFFRQEKPLTATWSTLRFLFLVAVGIVLSYVVPNGLWIVAVVDFAEEIPEIMYLRLELSHYLYIGGAAVIGV